jgi:hypothetical protein
VGCIFHSVVSVFVIFVHGHPSRHLRLDETPVVLVGFKVLVVERRGTSGRRGDVVIEVVRRIVLQVLREGVGLRGPLRLALSPDGRHLARERGSSSWRHCDVEGLGESERRLAQMEASEVGGRARAEDGFRLVKEGRTGNRRRHRRGRKRCSGRPALLGTAATSATRRLLVARRTRLGRSRGLRVFGVGGLFLFLCLLSRLELPVL